MGWTREPTVRPIAASMRDPAAFSLVFGRHFDAIHRYLDRRVGRQVADDLSAETFVRVAALPLGEKGSPNGVRTPCLHLERVVS